MRRVAIALVLAAAVAAGLVAVPAAGQQATVKVGIVIDITGGSSSLGVPERNTIQLYQEDMGTAQGPRGPVWSHSVLSDGARDAT
jgi:ABC-type branched-subunit amino acid transport system substrate-binding protein